MLGSVHDADDALQDTLLRAWRGAAGLRDADSARSWLYSIATNVCLTELRDGDKRVLPHEFGPAAVAAHAARRAGRSNRLGSNRIRAKRIGDHAGARQSRSELRAREGLELAFVAALQHLVAPQRAILILREVMGFSRK